MTTDTLTLTDFLLARIAEDEAVARSATPGPWEWSGDDMLNSLTAREGYAGPNGQRRAYRVRSVGDVPPDADRDYPASVIYSHGMHTEGYLDMEPEDRDHIARHDPARVLAECEAKRRIVEMLGYCEHRQGWGVMNCDGCSVLAVLATPYADHPDYRDEWRP